MKLRNPGPVYNRDNEADRNRQLEAADRENHKRGRDVEIGEGRLILTSPDGTRFDITVSNAGALVVTSI